MDGTARAQAVRADEIELVATARQVVSHGADADRRANVRGTCLFLSALSVNECSQGGGRCWIAKTKRAADCTGSNPGTAEE